VYNTSRSTTTTYTTTWGTSAGASRSTGINTTTTYTTTWTTSHVTSRSTTTTYGTSLAVSRSTAVGGGGSYTTEWSTQINYTTTWSTYYSYGTSWETTISYTTTWGSTQTWTTSWTTTISYYESVNTERLTDDGACLVEGTPVHVSTHVTVLIESLIKDAPVLTMDGPFNIESILELSKVSADTIANNLSSDDIMSAGRRYKVIGIVDINNGLLKSTGKHIHIIKRDGKWIAKHAEDIVIGDKLYHITNGEIEITSIVYDTTNTHTVYKLDIEPNDVYFANGILTHNKKVGLCDAFGGPEVCDPGSPCYDPCNPAAEQWGCAHECGGGGPRER
jgi:hypothetical protein